MKFYKSGEIALFVSLAVTVVLLVGCMVGDSNVHYTGVEDQALKEIVCGQTTKNQLLAKFGEPSEQSTKEDGSEILKYKCTKKIKKSFVLLPPVIVTNDETTIEHIVAFEVKDGIVKRYWKER
jgi:hypothetical protein